MSKPPEMNALIVDQIPISRTFKRKVILKFKWLVEHNGKTHASEQFSEMKTLVMEYVSLEYPRLEDFLDRAPWGRSLAKETFTRARACPHHVLDLIKIYTGFTSPVMTVEKSAEQMDRRLHRRLTSEQERFLSALCSSLRLGHGRRHDRTLRHIVSTWPQYSVTMPAPDWYADFDPATGRSDSFDLDFQDYCGLVYQSNPIGDLLRDQVLPYTESAPMEWGMDNPVMGEIHHIPKKGTVKRRPIAAPNRFIQAGFSRLYCLVSSLAQALPTDCTTDQSKFDQEIQSRLDNGDYVGSADLSAASDNLPMELGLAWLEGMAGHYAPADLRKVILSDISAFRWVSRGEWLNGPYRSVFQVGQPLGLWPSFPILALTNHAMVWLAGGTNQDYALLGDDIVFFDRKIRDRYFRLAERLAVPISYHKSYEGRLVEFAGKVFVKNHQPRYISDHAVVHYASLFDYQKSTGVAFDYTRLPSSVKTRWARRFPSSSDAKLAYELYQSYLGLRPVPSDGDVFVRFVEHLTDNQVGMPDRYDRAYRVPVFRQYFLQVGPDGHTNRTNVKEQNWYLQKYRPVSTDTVAECYVAASSEWASRPSRG